MILIKLFYVKMPHHINITKYNITFLDLLDCTKSSVRTRGTLRENFFFFRDFMISSIIILLDYFYNSFYGS